MFLHDGSISIELDNLKNQCPFVVVSMLSPSDLQPFDNSLINIFFLNGFVVLSKPQVELLQETLPVVNNFTHK